MVTRMRETYYLPGLSHGDNPVPMGSMVGPSFRSSCVMGRDPETGLMPPDRNRQVALAFANGEALLKLAGVGLEEITFIEVLIDDDHLRSEVNRRWVKWFPNESDRPARHVVVRELAMGMNCQIRIEAYSSRRAQEEIAKIVEAVREEEFVK